LATPSKARSAFSGSQRRSMVFLCMGVSVPVSACASAASLA
jgi:hypothetical protein